MHAIGKWLVALLILCGMPGAALAWGGHGHRTVAAIAMNLIPEKAARISAILAQLEIDDNFVDAASYPDEFIREYDPGRRFNPWHFSDLRDDGTPFVCGECLFKAFPDNLAIIRAGNKDKSEAVAIAWVLHLVGDLHQPLHMAERLRGGNDFHVTYRGKADCKNFQGRETRVELHSAWDDCLVEELASG
jgi:S1/P1 Nuclease